MASLTLDALTSALTLETDLITIATENAVRDKVEYKVQRALLTCLSPWFTTAVGEHFQEGQTRTLRFPETKPWVVQGFLFWLFHGSLVALDWEGHEQLYAARLWIFGDQHLLPKLQNEAMRMLHNSLLPKDENKADPDMLNMCITEIREVLQLSQTGSKLRQRIVRAVVDLLDGAAQNITSPMLRFIEIVDAFCSNIEGFYHDYGREMFRRRFDETMKNDMSAASGLFDGFWTRRVRDIKPYLLDEDDHEGQG